MKTILLFFSIFLATLSFSQTEKNANGNTKLTAIMIEKNYSAEERIELQKYPTKLLILDYIYSKSFEVVGNNSFTSEQFEKIDILKYDLTRKLDESVVVFDKASGLSLTLYSLNKMESDKKLFIPVNELKKDPSGKIAN